MTDAIVSVVVEQLASFVQQEVKLMVSVRKDADALSSTLETLRAVLHDAEARQIKERAVKLWLEKLKDIVYDAEDVLDECNTLNHNALIQGVEDGGVRVHKKVLSCLFSSCFSIGSVGVGGSVGIGVRYDIGSAIRQIRERLDQVADEKETFKLNQTPISEEPRTRLTSPIIDVSKTFGRDHDKDVIVSWVLDESSGQEMNTDVISIVGTGGFGKTTLAKLVLQEVQVQKAFEKRLWVCVSDPFNLTVVAKAVIEEATGNIPLVSEWPALHNHLCEALRGKRFLLVLDDVWTFRFDYWDSLKLAFGGGAQGSRIIVTTRNEEVAKMMGAKHRHNLAKLSDDASWLLFEYLAFAGRQEDISKFGEIGKKIVARCKGVPLVVKTIGSLMRFAETKKEWNDVLASELWEIQRIEEQILPSLFLSYSPLPSYLKHCFMYCAIFPKDERLYKDDLVQLWMAQGFLGTGGKIDLEKKGRDFFYELAMRSFFQDFEKSPEENITSGKMHDLVHDFAQFLTKRDCSFLEVDGELDDDKIRHLVTADMKCSSIYMAKKLRTLMITEFVETEQLIKIFDQLKCIRTLSLGYCDGIEKFPSEVKRLLHLRLLNLSETLLVELPDTICLLYNLQTLKLNYCRKLIKLPDGIVSLLNLRHLELKATDRLSCLPRGIGRLRFLRSLGKFIVGDASSGCNIRELKDLSNLQGSLQIIGLERVADVNDAAQAELKNKPVDKLSLKFESFEKGESETMGGVLENLQPHENVEELSIHGFGGSRFPYWIPNTSMSANLLRLTLLKCFNTT